MLPNFTFELGDQTIRVSFYPILITFGLCHLIIATDSLGRKEGFTKESIRKCIYALCLAILGGGLITSVVTPLFYSGRRDWGSISAMPGIISGLAVFALILRQYKLEVWKHLNLIAPFVCFAHGWGRLGCFLGGCCHGQPTSSFLGVHFHPNSSAYKQFDGTPLHATQMYEAGFLFALGWLLIKKCPTPMRFVCYVIAYGIGRFLMEFIRGDDRGAILGITVLSPSQILSLCYVGFGVGLMYRYKSRFPESH
ncbi:MAG: hypothetical protein CMI31_02500 [Opitutae bacterium]|nr:hypothetical protein [Opitutae bacterium]